MGRYLEKIKKSESRGEENHQNLQNPLVDSFVGFVGAPSAPFEKNTIPNSGQKSHAELTSLLRLCGERYAFTEAEHTEALAAALADPVDALTCFRAIALRTGNDHA